MKRAAVAAVLLVASTSVAGVAHAADIERYGSEGQFGDWIVLCDSEDDMGGTTYLDCAVQSASQSALVIWALTDGPVLSFDGSASSSRLTIADTAFDFSACPGGRCPFAGSTSDFVDLISANTAILDTGDGQTTISPDGLGEAIEHAIQLID